ncbi:flagellar basal body rod protein FlgB [Desulfogranum marinum]|uniref:flagellar basal body rod protein FlgB n=1 Tax=Desulfogranum marinum TaxID=453220 RepID=UPI001963D285|nr:flagellar basal body rod protein FlgB [Desulfogranum marinum]MBM9513195.1 flagellar basal body rod protein FlgB [Desulfogranum marinum]
MPLLQQLDSTSQMLQKVLDLRAKNQQVIGSNIANAETPGYKAKSLEFEDQLKSAMSGAQNGPVTTHPNHIPLQSTNLAQIEGTMTTKTDNTGIGDENSVSVDQEMVKLSENQILYETAVTMLKKKLSLLKYTINGGA